MLYTSNSQLKNDILINKEKYKYLYTYVFLYVICTLLINQNVKNT